jgi:diacylglycerol kinase family enzyme
VVPDSEVACGSVIYEGPARLVAASTIPYYGYGLRAFPYAAEHTDRMNLRVSNLPISTFLRNARAIWRGEFHDDRRITDFLVDRVDIEMEPPTPFQIGGDFESVRPSVHLGVTPRPIRLVDFYAPPSAI